MTKTFAIYTRVSTRGQKTDSQERELRRWLGGQDTEGLRVRWFSDKASGLSMQRPEWLKVEDLIRRGEVGKLVVWRLDRLGRTTSGLTQLFDDLRAAKVEFVSVRDGLDLSTPSGRMMAGVIASVAQYESEIKAERIVAGQMAARARGRRWGGSRKGHGSKLTPTVLAAVADADRRGETLRATARLLGMCEDTVRKARRMNREQRAAVA